MKIITALQKKNKTLALKVAKILGSRPKTLETKKDFKELAKWMEQQTGYKMSIKKHGKGSMYGYVSIRARKKKDEDYPEWDFNFGRKLLKMYAQPEPTPTFVSNNNMFDYYVGNHIYPDWR